MQKTFRTAAIAPATIVILMLLMISVSTLGAMPMRESYEPSSIITFKTTDEGVLQLHVFVPSGHKPSDNRPAIVFFHGGGWRGGSPVQFYPHCYYLAERGMVAITAEYRLEGRHGTTPREAAMDAKSAMRFARMNAEEMGINPEMIAAGGGSAGGHLAAAVALIQGFEEEDEDLNISARPNALVLFNPVYDNGPDGSGYDRVEKYWRAFSPIHNINEHPPPSIVFLGTEDHLIPVATAEKFRHLMVQNGIRSELVLYEGATHVFFNYRGNKKYFRATIAETDRFLTSLGYLTGPPAVEVKK